MNSIGVVWRKSLVGLFFVALLGGPILAASLKESIYLDLAWGKAAGQMGHSTPGKGQDDEGEWAGPTSFAVSAQGDVGVIDMVNERVQILSKDGKVRGVLPFKYSLSWVDDIDADTSGRWFLLADREAAGLSREHGIWRYVSSEIPAKMIDLKLSGIQMPLNLELGQNKDLLVQDNHSFTTYRIDFTGHVLDKKADDDRLFYLASKGLYTVGRDKEMIRIQSKEGTTIAHYADVSDTFSVLGLSRSGALIILVEGPAATYTLEGLAMRGEKVFSISFQDTPLFRRITPTRIAGLRNVRVGPDGALYAMGKPEDDRFRIYRYQIEP